MWTPTHGRPPPSTLWQAWAWWKAWEGMYEPDRAISRAEVDTVVNNMLARADDRSYIDIATGLKRFPDVSEAYWGFYEIV